VGEFAYYDTVNMIIKIIIISTYNFKEFTKKFSVLKLIIFINCNWVVTRWQWLFYMYTNMKEKVTREFKSGGLHERHVVATWKLGNHLSIHL